MTAEFADAEPLIDPPTTAEFRRAMGMFASGVTVVTGLDDGEPVGFTCQSFASVSLEPPLILFCADHRGRAWPRIRKSGRFCVNVLGEDQVELCGRFGSSTGGKFDGLGWDLSRWGVPALRDVLLRVHGEVRDVHVAGDHDVVIGLVRELEPVTEQQPMLFYRGRFGLGERRPGEPGANLWSWGDY
ncbi:MULTISPECIES: flavin reductase family protein [Nonomuraea]|uniref:Flavin reductase family protein n=1 Tax=Nonomuraea harbinensis TaxID=1286938 RepID=A0ABW1C2B3_9ACTN|nr:MULTISPECIES: flavin reductase family protein [Nonomuraea]TXK40340.1 flavin reductase family protein [Nonomuraea sp. C10]